MVALLTVARCKIALGVYCGHNRIQAETPKTLQPLFNNLL